jgi:phospholipase/carboxylesterase
MALSCYLLQADSLETWSHASARAVPIYMGHGTQDPVVPIALGEQAAERLRGAGFDPSWHRYPMPHSVSPEQIQDIDQWLDQRLQ